MKIFYLFLLLPLTAIAYDPPPPAGYTYDQSVCGNPCTSPNWTYYYPTVNGVTPQTPSVIFKLPDSSPSGFAFNTSESHTGGGGALELFLLLSVMAIRRHRVR